MEKFLDELASSSPAPGGGSVSALCGSLGAALNSMVCNLTIGKKGYESVSDEMEEILEISEGLRKELYALIEEDSQAFNEVMAAFRLPKETDEQKQSRKQAIQEALKGASLVPLKVAGLCLEVSELSKKTALKGNKNSITDSAVAALVARAGFQGAYLNALINLGSIKDENFRDQVMDELKLLEENSASLTREVLDIVGEQL